MSNKFALDYNKFKHIASDQESTKLQHPDGHEIVLKHDKLPPKMKAQFETLAKNAATPLQKDQMKHKEMAEGGMTASDDSCYAGGGKVWEISNKTAGKKPEVKKPAATEGATLDYKELKKEYYEKNKNTYDSEGKTIKRKMYAEGEGDVSAEDNAPMDETPGAGMPIHLPSKDQIAKALADNMIRGQQAKDAAVEQHIAQDQIPGGIEQSGPLGANPNTVSRMMQEKGIGGQQQPQQASPPQQPQTPIAEAAQNAPQPPQMPMGEEINAAANQVAKEAIPVMQKAAEIKAQTEQKAFDQKLNADAQVQQHFQQTTDKLEQERQMVMQEIRNKQINPDQYWQNNSRLATGLGIIIAGLGGNSEMPINFLKSQIEQNINAQAKNLESQHNLLRANLDQFKNVRDAADMTRLMVADQLKDKIEGAAAASNLATAKANGQMAVFNLEKEMFPIRQQLYMRHAMNTFMTGGNSVEAKEQALRQLAVTNPELYKEEIQKFVPGLGSASVPVSENTRKELLAHQKFDRAAADLQEFLKQNGGVLQRMNPKAQAIAAQKAMTLQALFREGTLGTVYREGEQPLLDKAVRSNPLSFAGYLTEGPKLQELRAINSRGFDSLRSSLGGDLARGAKANQQMQQQQAVKPEIKTINGVQYMRGPDGKAVRVK
jgi:hypothetical protein